MRRDATSATEIPPEEISPGEIMDAENWDPAPLCRSDLPRAELFALRADQDLWWHNRLVRIYSIVRHRREAELAVS